MWPKTAEAERELVGFVLGVWATFFLLAGISAPFTNQRLQMSNNSTILNMERRLLRQMKEQIYADMFGAYQPAGNSFMTSQEARNFLQFDPMTRKRKPHCGRWMTNVPRLVLRLMGRRCAPLQLA